jgi:hypothetical protein
MQTTAQRIVATICLMSVESLSQKPIHASEIALAVIHQIMKWRLDEKALSQIIRTENWKSVK